MNVAYILVGMKPQTGPPKKVPIPNVERSARTRQGIVQAAVACFSKQGFLMTTVDDIVKTAGVTKGAFYHHFKSKDEVLARIQEDLLTAQVEQFQEIADSAGTARDKLTAMVRALVHTAIEDRAAVTVWDREDQHLKPKHRAAFLALRTQLDTIIADTIASGVKSGELRKAGDARALAAGILGMTTWTREWYRADGELSVDDVAGLYSELVINGLGGST